MKEIAQMVTDAGFYTVATYKDLSIPGGLVFLESYERVNHGHLRITGTFVCVTKSTTYTLDILDDLGQAIEIAGSVLPLRDVRAVTYSDVERGADFPALEASFTITHISEEG
ncbi:hypothetical protein [Zhihengliuella halotolerans]|nr:hypothetical protein [Zhihengliuella halotolerans]